jgi:hypothetical protein
MKCRFAILLYLFAVAALLLSGCGGEKLPPGIPKLYPATLAVIQDGSPLAGAEVSMLNTDPSVSWSAGGITDQNGILKLRTMGRYIGAPAGKYKVAVQKIEMPAIPLPDEPPNDPEQRKEYNRLLKEIEDNTFYLVDQQFELDKTKLEVEITPTNLQLTVDVSPAVRVKVPPTPKG